MVVLPIFVLMVGLGVINWLLPGPEGEEVVARTVVDGAVATMVLEYEQGVAIIAPIGADAVLLVLTTLPETGALLYELRRNRGRLATLV